MHIGPSILEFMHRTATLTDVALISLVSITTQRSATRVVLTVSRCPFPPSFLFSHYWSLRNESQICCQSMGCGELSGASTGKI